MQIVQAKRQRSAIKIALQGPSGSGKTYSSLLLAYGLCQDWSKICVVDTENGSSHLYSELGSFNVISLNAPYTPERYEEALRTAQNVADVVILDTISPCWENLVDYHSTLPGNSFANWSRVTPRHNAFVYAVTSSPKHVICTMRTKHDYVVNIKNGKHVPEKVGLKAVQRDGIDYEFTCVFSMAMNHMAHCSKDRTGLFPTSELIEMSSTTGEKVLNWLLAPSSLASIKERIARCEDLDALRQLYHDIKVEDIVPKSLFEQKRDELKSLVS